MQEAAQFHHEAMNFADQAALARLRGDAEQALAFSRQALRLEKTAAERLRDRWDVEPSRSVLYRSAASLALTCGEIREAERLVAMALAGDPPDEIADELRDLLDAVRLRRPALHAASSARDERATL